MDDLIGKECIRSYVLMDCRLLVSGGGMRRTSLLQAICLRISMTERRYQSDHVILPSDFPRASAGELGMEMHFS